MVAALLTAPVDERCVTGVIFFDRNLVLGMCGHGMIGLIETLHRLGRIGPGEHLVETPAGVVPVVLADRRPRDVRQRRQPPRRARCRGRRTFARPCHRRHRLRRQRVLHRRHPGGRPRPATFRAAAASPPTCWAPSMPPASSTSTTSSCTDRRRPPGANSRNFVLCPSGTYDRSPCGTGTSAKVAALAAAGALEEGATWVQESITGSTFAVHYRWADRATGSIVPTVSGRATVTGRGELFITREEHGG